MKFIAVQIGARRGYAVPEIFERVGMLERFYTDLCGSVGLGAMFASLESLPLGRGRLARLAARQIPNSVRDKTRTFGGPVCRNALRSLFSHSAPATCFRNHLHFGKDLGEAMIRAGYGDATHIFTMLGEGGPFVAEAYRRGLIVVAEVYILLSTERLMREERRAFPDWEPETPDYAALRQQHMGEDVLGHCTHFYICPSEAVQDDLVSHWNVARECTALVPYGMHPRWLELEPQPQRGRILFVGTADLRKGIHYLAMAAQQLRARGFTGEFRVAGNVTEQVRKQLMCQHLNFLGRVPRERIHEEFQAADVFVLPSLAEGSAEVTYEALAAGVPVVTTRATGSVVRDGIEGFIVPERNVTKLAEAIQTLVDDRGLRDHMGMAARERARDYTWSRYGERLVAALQTMRAKPE